MLLRHGFSCKIPSSRGLIAHSLRTYPVQSTTLRRHVIPPLGRTIFTRPLQQRHEFPQFAPSYPSYFFPSRFSPRYQSTPATTVTDIPTFAKAAVKESSESLENVASTANRINLGNIESVDGAEAKLPPKWMSKWLFACAGLTFGVIIVGGVTRLTESGLSITEWKPITGVIPPLNDTMWQEEFQKYKATPEFKLLNSSIDVDAFKSIYYMEWGHRVLGRVIGAVYAVPFLYLLASKRVPGSLKTKLGGLGLLLGFQGALGWYMVKSGLDDRIIQRGDVPRVSQYRLAAHLGAALLFFTGTLRLGLALKKDRQWASGGLVNGVGNEFATILRNPNLRRLKLASSALLLLAFTTALSGAFVAGLDAGLIYNEFPYMGEGLMPPTEELFRKSYSKRGDGGDIWWRNMLENPTTAQFDHRVLAMSTYFSTALLYAWARTASWKTLLPPTTKHLVGASFAMANIQAVLGISTLLYLVPVPLAASHQAGSVLLLTVLVALLTSLRRPSTLASAVRAAKAARTATKKTSV